MSGGNIDAATGEIVEKWNRLADEIAKAQAELKDLKARAKDEGFNLKCLAQAVKELRKGAEYQCDQLTLELEMQTYRSNVGLPTTVEEAQKLVLSEKRGGEDADRKAKKRASEPLN